MNPVSKLVCTAALLLVVLVAGCGGSNPPATQATGEADGKPRNLKKYDFVFHASIVCKKGLEQADVAMHKAAGEPVPKPPPRRPTGKGRSCR